MDGIGHKLAIGKGMKQDHYASIQRRITDDIESLTKELKYNRKWYVSCLKCNKVFFKDILIHGMCKECFYPVEKEVQMDALLIMNDPIIKE